MSIIIIGSLGWAAGRLVLLARIILLLCVLLEGRADEIQGGGMPGFDRRAPSPSDLIIFCYYLFIFFKNIFLTRFFDSHAHDSKFQSS